MSAPVVEDFELQVIPVTDMDGGLWNPEAPDSKSNSKSCVNNPPRAAADCGGGTVPPPIPATGCTAPPPVR